MKKKSASQSAFFNVRVLIGVVILCIGVFLALLGFGAFSNALASSEQKSGAQKPAAAFNESGPRVISAFHTDVSRPLRDAPTVWPPAERKAPHEAALNPMLPHRHVDGRDPVVQNKFFMKDVQPYIPGPILNFDGVPFPGVVCNCAPPDTNGAVGKTQYVQIVNEGYQVFDKTTGTSVLGPNSISSVWSGFGGTCESNGDGDPVVLYDRLADRWVISQFAGSGTPTDECIAVSQTGDATGAYYRYGFHLGANFFDYPKLAVWPDAYYMADNVFNSGGTAFLGVQAFAFDRSKMLVGDATATVITPGFAPQGTNEEYFLPADLDGIIPPTAGAANPFIEGPFTGNIYRVYLYHVDFANPVNQTFTQIATPAAAAFTQICPTTRACIPEPSGAAQLDSLGDRLMFRNAYRKFPDGHEAIVGNHTVSSGGVAGVRWFEMRNPIAAPVVFQESTYQPDTTWRWMASAAQDNQGNMAIGFNVSSASPATIHPGLSYAGRLAGDPLNVLSQGEAVLFAGLGDQSGTGNRWGDYSALQVDPVDDCTFWYTSEYYPTGTTTFNWRTRIGNFKFAQCTAPSKGTAHFTVTVCDGGSALAGALISIDGNLYGGSLATGLYDATLAPGAHTYSVSKPPTYGAVTGNFNITNGQTTNISVCLTGTPLIQSSGSSIAAEGCSPSNGVIDPNETVTVNLKVMNVGGASTTNLVGTLQATGGVTNPSGPQNYGVVPVSGMASRPFTFTASGTCGGTITATLQLQDGATNLGTVTYTFTLGALIGPLNESFDGVVAPALPAGWTTDQGTNQGGFPMWVTSNAGTPAPPSDSAPNAAFTQDPANLLDNRIYSPVINYGAGSQLTFRQNFDLEQLDATTAYDAGVLEINVNGGGWVDIIAAGGSFVTGGYNHTAISTGFANPLLPSRACWSGVSTGFMTTTVSLPAAGVGMPAQFRWRMGSDNSVSHTGWRIDNVMIAQRVCSTNCTAPTVSGAVSRKMHAGAGNFDIPLPLSGTAGIECRSGGGTNDYTMVVTFAANVSVTGAPQAQVTSGTGVIGTGGVANGGAVSVAGNVVTIPLTNVGNAQTMTVTLNGVTDGATTGNLTIPMSKLLGDSNANGAVNASDASQTKSRIGQVVGAGNFRSDININAAINASDVSIIKGAIGTAVP
ncbi:MAG: dockerin type I domain-containing protein [Verrucomicrobiota bacterium]